MDDFTIFYIIVMLHVARTTPNGWFYNFYTSVMLHVARITLDVVMLYVARITLDEAEWMVLQFLH